MLRGSSGSPHAVRCPLPRDWPMVARQPDDLVLLARVRHPLATGEQHEIPLWQSHQRLSRAPRRENTVGKFVTVNFLFQRSLVRSTFHRPSGTSRGPPRAHQWSSCRTEPASQLPCARRRWALAAVCVPCALRAGCGSRPELTEWTGEQALEACKNNTSMPAMFIAKLAFMIRTETRSVRLRVGWPVRHASSRQSALCPAPVSSRLAANAASV